MVNHPAEVIFGEGRYLYMEQSKAKKPIYKKWWFWLILVVIVGIIGAAAGLNGSNQGTDGSDSSASGAQTEESGSAEEAAVEVSAVDLINAYDENAVSADSQYKDKTLKITGTVSSIGVDVADRAYIMLKDENDPYAILGVQCYFEEDQKDSLTSLKEGDTVTVIGTCEGQVVSVSVKNCQITE